MENDGSADLYDRCHDIYNEREGEASGSGNTCELDCDEPSRNGPRHVRQWSAPEIGGHAAKLEDRGIGTRRRRTL
jgi:hypothetical protein